MGLGAIARFTVSNTGSLAGATVGQIYIHQAHPSVQRPDIELGGFAKVHLAPGESASLEVVIDVSSGLTALTQHKAFSFYDVSRKAWLAERGDYEVRLGSSSRAIHCAKPFHLKQSYTWVGLREPTVL